MLCGMGTGGNLGGVDEQPKSAPATAPPSQTWDAPPPKSRPGAVVHITIWVPILLGLYMLSIGPAARFCQADWRRMRTLRTIYAPVRAATDKSRPAGDLFAWYINKWVLAFSWDFPDGGPTGLPE